MSADGPPSGEAPVNALTASQQVLDCFWNLADKDEEKRLKAADSLVRELMDRQREYSEQQRKSTDSKSVNTPVPTLEELESLPKPRRQELALQKSCPLMVYALRRLIRGLGSGRPGARQGFSTALALLLSQQSANGLGFVEARDVLVLLDTCLEATNSVKAGEVRDILVGRLFGLGALVRSGLLNLTIEQPVSLGGKAKTPGKKGKAAKPAEQPLEASDLIINHSLENHVWCVKELLSLASSKSFLREVAVGVVLELIQNLGSQGALQLLKASPQLQAFLKVKHREATPEALDMALCLWPILPAEHLKAAPLPPNCPSPPPSLLNLLLQHSLSATPTDRKEFASAGTDTDLAAFLSSAASAAYRSSLFSSSYLESVLPCLQGSITSNPRMHSLWQRLLPLLLPGMACNKSKEVSNSFTAPSVSVRQLESFWTVVVERGLLTTPSHERKFLAFRLFQTMLPHLGPEHIPVVLSRDFARVLANNLLKKDNYLHAAAKRCLEALNTFVAGGSSGSADRLAVAGVLKRLGAQGLNLEQLRVLQGGSGPAKGGLGAGKGLEPNGLLAGLDALGVQNYITSLMHTFCSAGQTSSQSESASGTGARTEEHTSEGEAAVAAAAADLASRAESERAIAVEQLVAASRFQAASQADIGRVLNFLAIHAFLTVSTVQTKTAPVSWVVKESKKKQAGKGDSKNSSSTAAAAETDGAVPSGELQSAASLAVSVSAATRRLCTQRLVTLTGHFAPHKQQRGGSSSSSSSSSSSGGGSDVQQAPPHAAHVDGPALVSDVMQLLHLAVEGGEKYQASGLKVELTTTLSEDQDVSLTVLREIEAALEKKVAITAVHTGGALKDASSRPLGSPAALRGMLHLIRILQLNVIGDPEGLDPDLAAGIRRIAKEGLGASLDDLEVQAMPEAEDDGKEEGVVGDAGQDGAQEPWQNILVDVILTLLSRPATTLPTAPIREAVEAVWRGLAEGSVLTAAGMLDLVRVVVASAGQSGEGDDVIGDDDEEEVEEEMEVEEEADDDDTEEEEEEDDDDDNLEEDKGAVHKQVQENIKQMGEGKEGSEDEDEAEDVADDAEMFKMDAKMAAYLRDMVDQRKGAKERKLALANLRLRALALIEAFAKKAPGSPLLLLVVAPLAQAFADTRRSPSGASADLANRLRSVLRLVSVKPGRPLASLSELPMTVTDLESSLKKSLNIASRERDREAAQAASLAWCTLIKGASAAVEIEGALEVASHSFLSGMNDLLHKKKSRLHRSSFEMLLREAPAAALPALPNLLDSCLSLARGGASSSSSSHSRVEALLLLAALLHPSSHMSGGKKAKSKLAVEEAEVKGEGEVAEDASSSSLLVLREAVMQQGTAVGAALVAAATGEGHATAASHVKALKAAVLILERLVVMFQRKRLVEVLGHNFVTGMARSIATVREIGVSTAVEKQLSRLVTAAGIADLVSKTGPDPALKSKLLKARATLSIQTVLTDGDSLPKTDKEATEGVDKVHTSENSGKPTLLEGKGKKGNVPTKKQEKKVEEDADKGSTAQPRKRRGDGEVQRNVGVSSQSREVAVEAGASKRPKQFAAHAASMDPSKDNAKTSGLKNIPAQKDVTKGMAATSSLASISAGSPKVTTKQTEAVGCEKYGKRGVEALSEGKRKKPKS